MAPKIRKDLVVPPELDSNISRYKHVPAKPRSEATGMVAQSLPMAAMFLRNKLMSWSALFLAVQSFLSEPYNSETAKEGTQPPLLKLLFAFISVAICYIDLIFPAANPAKKAAQIAAEKATSAASTTLSIVTSSATN